MKIAIFGATSFIAKDLIQSFTLNSQNQLDLYSRKPPYKEYTEFSVHTKYDAIINFIGVGDPGKAITLGESIVHTTREYDQLIMQYLQTHSDTKYIFISSGAVYGNAFLEPVQEHSFAQIPINSNHSNDWYAKAKLYAELNHRAHSQFAIVDLRVFNYFSANIDLSAKYLICDLINCLRSQQPLLTSPENIWRDYLSQRDFYQIIDCILQAPLMNTAFDCYSQAPIDKISLLETMQKHFGLCYTFTKANDNKCSLNYKKNYYSLNQSAAGIGYKPSRSSVDCLIQETEKIKEQYVHNFAES